MSDSAMAPRSLADEHYDRVLPPDEFLAALRASELDEEENARIAEHIAWFIRRYPTVEARLAYVRNRTAAWRRAPKV